LGTVLDLRFLYFLGIFTGSGFWAPNFAFRTENIRSVFYFSLYFEGRNAKPAFRIIDDFFL